MNPLQKKLLWGYIAVSLGLLISGGAALQHFFSKSQVQKATISALTDTVHHYKTKDGQNAAYIQTIIADKKSLIAAAGVKDSTIAKLLKSDKHIVEATHVVTQIRIDTVTKADTAYMYANGKIRKVDSLVFDKTIINKWYTANINFHFDSLALKLTTADDLTLDHRTKSQGLFKPDLLDVNVINLNPYATNIGLSSYEIAPPPVHRGAYVALGAVGTFLIMLLIHK